MHLSIVGPGTSKWERLTEFSGSPTTPFALMSVSENVRTCDYMGHADQVAQDWIQSADFLLQHVPPAKPNMRCPRSAELNSGPEAALLHDCGPLNRQAGSSHALPQEGQHIGFLHVRRSIPFGS